MDRVRRRAPFALAWAAAIAIGCNGADPGRPGDEEDIQRAPTLLGELAGTWTTHDGSDARWDTLVIKKDGTYYAHQTGTDAWDNGALVEAQDVLTFAGGTIRGGVGAVQVCGSSDSTVCYRMDRALVNHCFRDHDCALQCNALDAIHSHECAACNLERNECVPGGAGLPFDHDWSPPSWIGTYYVTVTSAEPACQALVQWSYGSPPYTFLTILKRDGTLLVSPTWSGTASNAAPISEWASGTYSIASDGFSITRTVGASDTLLVTGADGADWYGYTSDWCNLHLTQAAPLCFSDGDCTLQNASGSVCQKNTCGL